VKLATLPGMTSEAFIKTDYDLLYRKVMLGQQSQFMDFPRFIVLLEKLTQKVRRSFFTIIVVQQPIRPQ
jgi:hypothetical protein